MEILIPYVNGDSEVWRAVAAKYLKLNTPNRYRDFGFLKYLFRGIDAYMPFIDRVSLVVSGEDQVPEWVNREEVRIIHHADFIPPTLLPTFNTYTIEMFIALIPDLEEEILWFNDDFFPTNMCYKEDYFLNGKPCLHFTHKCFRPTVWRWTLANSINLLMPHYFRSWPPRIGKFLLQPQHIVIPMYRSEVKRVYNTYRDALILSCSKERNTGNFNGYIYIYGYVPTLSYNDKIFPYKYYKVKNGYEDIVIGMFNKNLKFICINDDNKKVEHLDVFRAKVLEAFQKKFPSKCKYEKHA